MFHVKHFMQKFNSQDIDVSRETFTQDIVRKSVKHFVTKNRQRETFLNVYLCKKYEKFMDFL